MPSRQHIHGPNSKPLSESLPETTARPNSTTRTSSVTLAPTRHWESVCSESILALAPSWSTRSIYATKCCVARLTAIHGWVTSTLSPGGIGIELVASYDDLRQLGTPLSIRHTEGSIGISPFAIRSYRLAPRFRLMIMVRTETRLQGASSVSISTSHKIRSLHRLWLNRLSILIYTLSCRVVTISRCHGCPVCTCRLCRFFDSLYRADNSLACRFSDLLFSLVLHQRLVGRYRFFLHDGSLSSLHRLGQLG